MHKHMFVNLPIRDMKKSQAFFRSVGYEFNPQFTNDQGACLVAGENLFVMLLVTDFFKTFTGKPVADAHNPPRYWWRCPATAAPMSTSWWPARVPPAARCRAARRISASCIRTASRTWTATSGSWCTWSRARCRQA